MPRSSKRPHRPKRKKRKPPARKKVPKKAKDDLQTLLGDLMEQRNIRKSQIAIIKEFCEDPLRFMLQPESTTDGATNLRERKRALEYRRDVLRTLVEIMESELKLLSRALVSS